MISDIEYQIHALEQEAYGAVLRAFKAQSDALSWDKEELITNLRRELRVSDDEHRDVLTKVNADPVLRSIREWRKKGGIGATPHLPQTVDQLHSPTISAPHKRQKSSHSASFGTPSQLSHPQGILERRPQPMVLPSAPMSYQHTNQGPGSFITSDHPQRTRDHLLGRKVMIRLSDGNFYEAMITQYNPLEGRHALAYDINTPNEWQEWVDLDQIPSEDIHWVDDEPGISRQTAGDGQLISRNSQMSSRVQIPFRKQVENEVRPSQNIAVSDIGNEIEILHTDTLLQKVERVLDTSHPDLRQLEKAKKMLKDHEQSLLDVISKLADACESSNSDREPQQQQQQLYRQQLMHGQRHNGANIAPEIRGGSTPSFIRGRGHSTSHIQQEEDVVIV